MKLSPSKSKLKFKLKHACNLKTLLTGLVIALSSTPYLAQADEALLKRKDVQNYISDFSKKYNIPKSTLDNLFLAVKPRKKVIHKTNHPAEAMTWDRYKHLFITQSKVRNGVKFWHDHQATLAKAEEEYGVPASIIVATIGIESNYSSNKGKFRVLDTLSNLAFNYPSRSKFFKYELTEFLVMTLVDDKQNPLDFYGSYAGAMGMTQFMPHSIRQFGVDYSNSGKVDLSNDADDAIGSVANYYSYYHWHYGEPVTSYANTNTKTQKLAANKTYSEKKLAQKGYINSNPWPKDINSAMLIDLTVQHGHEYWLAYNNFTVIEKYNRSPLYAMAVYQLSRKIDESYQKAYNAPSKNVQ